MEFILNNKTIKTEHPSGMTLLDFIRYEQSLTGTKIGCREGDCGACTVLVGSLKDDGQLRYQSMTSCLVPLVNLEGKHVVTIEGLNMNELTPIQQSMVEEGGTQCGFCTVGFVVSLSGYALESSQANYEEALSAIDGNICRCTGYKSIERAAQRLVQQLKNKKIDGPISWLVQQKFIPEYFNKIPDRLSALNPILIAKPSGQNGPMVGGGTDLYVQRPDELTVEKVHSFHQQQELKGINLVGKTCTVGAATTVTELLESEVFQSQFPNLRKHLKLVSSTPIRNMSTVGGNFVNASPIGDLTIFFLALNSSIALESDDGSQRVIALKDFYKGYKKLDKSKTEYIKSISFNNLRSASHFNFEKVSKRTYLDIASVNTAIQLQMEGNSIAKAHASAGGVSPIPMYLKEANAFLIGKTLTTENVSQAAEVMQQEIAPISDARGSKEYKRLLLRQLFYAHFITLFPENFELEALV